MNPLIWVLGSIALVAIVCGVIIAGVAGIILIIGNIVSRLHKNKTGTAGSGATTTAAAAAAAPTIASKVWGVVRWILGGISILAGVIVVAFVGFIAICLLLYFFYWLFATPASPSTQPTPNQQVAASQPTPPAPATPVGMTPTPGASTGGPWAYSNSQATINIYPEHEGSGISVPLTPGQLFKVQPSAVADLTQFPNYTFDIIGGRAKMSTQECPDLRNDSDWVDIPANTKNVHLPMNGTVVKVIWVFPCDKEVWFHYHPQR